MKLAQQRPDAWTRWTEWFSRAWPTNKRFVSFYPKDHSTFFYLRGYEIAGCLTVRLVRYDTCSLAVVTDFFVRMLEPGQQNALVTEAFNFACA